MTNGSTPLVATQWTQATRQRCVLQKGMSGPLSWHGASRLHLTNLFPPTRYCPASGPAMRRVRAPVGAALRAPRTRVHRRLMTEGQRRGLELLGCCPSLSVCRCYSLVEYHETCSRVVLTVLWFDLLLAFRSRHLRSDRAMALLRRRRGRTRTGAASDTRGHSWVAADAHRWIPTSVR